MHNYLTLFNNNPTCRNVRAYSKRAIEALWKRDGQTLTLTQETALISALTSAFLAIRSGAQSNLAASITTDFDNLVGNAAGVHGSDFVGAYNAFPDLDPLQVTESLLCASSRDGNWLPEQTDITNCACQLPSNLRSGAVGPPNIPHLSKRTVEWSWPPIAGDANGGEPSVGQIIQGVTSGALQYMYTRILRYTGQGTVLEGIIEMAWQIPAGNAGDAYRSTGADQYVVMHAHVNHIFVPQEGGPRYPGIYGYVSIFPSRPR